MRRTTPEYPDNQDPFELPATGKARRQPQQARSRAMMARVIESATQLVVERNPEEVTTSLIAERAGVSAAWIYQYFESREQIFDVIVLDATRRVFELTRQSVMGAVERPLREIVQSSLEASFHFCAREPAFRKLYMNHWYSKHVLHEHELTDLAQARWLYTEMTQRGLLCPGESTQCAIELAVVLSNRGLEQAFRTDPRGNAMVIHQLVDAVIGILDRYRVSPDANSASSPSSPAAGKR
ncbi:TetR/AcrR family transcriptional regulator [Burkholderia sp. Tr-20390]|uniref:TetR/AcrR family transcriptional regulator n=1 Tax=Burkholderia sp. Tr-20390 TaxID=2703904 RepID=UPI001981389B|nr:TetR/AcrR family transcriptional regulator [Burkholderia sp. Tr-20390]MBN3735509.1 TetR/AcrR family transcriptional regulator [Burkholderia sp. Tr-20390]